MWYFLRKIVSGGIDNWCVFVQKMKRTGQYFFGVFKWEMKKGNPFL